MSMCNQTFHMDLVKLSSQYIDNSFIMEQISCITMYFATMRTWITFPEVLTLVKNLMSYTYAICDDKSRPIVDSELHHRIYPIFSIFQNMAQFRSSLLPDSHAAKGLQLLKQIHCVSAMQTYWLRCEDDKDIAGECCRVLLRFVMDGSGFSPL